MSSSEFDFVAVGDIVVDDFIRLKEAEVHCEIDREKCQICMSFKDKVPFEFTKVVYAVGNSPNAAVAASRLGLRSAVVTNLGNDANGKYSLEYLENDGVETKFVKVHDGISTNYHYVLWYENDRTILIKHQEYQYELPLIGKPKWIYLSSLGENSLPFHEKISAYLDNNKSIKLAFQPGTYQIKFGAEALQGIYQRTSVFISNKEEAQKILKTNEENIKKLLTEIQKLGPKIVLLTDGPKGVYMSDGKTNWFIKAYPDEKPPYERTGAGDAFASTFVSALALGKSPEEALAWGPVNSMSVVQYIGAQEGLLSRDTLESYLKKLPFYKAEKIT